MSSNVVNHRNYTVSKNIPPFLKPKPASSKQALLPARDSPLAPPVIIRVPERLAAWMSFRNTRLAGRPRLRGHPIHRSFSLSPWTSAIVRSLKRPRKPARILLHAFCSTHSAPRSHSYRLDGAKIVGKWLIGGNKREQTGLHYLSTRLQSPHVHKASLHYLGIAFMYPTKDHRHRLGIFHRGHFSLAKQKEREKEHANF